MTWNVIQNDIGDLQMIPHNDPVPAGWVVVVETANPDYLEYMAGLATQ